MINFKLNEMKGMFFDSPKVMAAVDKATRTVLSRFGAYVRTAARSSIRKRKKSSAPGTPPSSHTGELKRFIFFGYDVHRRSVVIGPTRLNAKAGTAPEALEHGGNATVVSYDKTRGKQKRTVNISQRPFMAPALKQELPKLPAMWQDSVKP